MLALLDAVVGKVAVSVRVPANAALLMGRRFLFDLDVRGGRLVRSLLDERPVVSGRRRIRLHLGSNDVAVQVAVRVRPRRKLCVIGTTALSVGMLVEATASLLAAHALVERPIGDECRVLSGLHPVVALPHRLAVSCRTSSPSTF